MIDCDKYSDYSRRILVDTPLRSLSPTSSQKEIDDQLLAALRHRTKLPLDILVVNNNDADDDPFADPPSNRAQSKHYTTYQSLLSLSQNCDVVAQQFIAAALLERNLLVPYQWSDSTGRFMSPLKSALWFTKHQNVENIMENVTLPRVLVCGQASSGITKAFLQEFAKVDTLMDSDHSFPMIEIGLCEIFASDERDATKSLLTMRTRAIIIYAVGIDNAKIEEFLKLGIDTVVYELKEGTKACLDSAKRFFQRDDSSPKLILLHERVPMARKQDGLLLSSMKSEHHGALREIFGGTTCSNGAILKPPLSKRDGEEVPRKVVDLLRKMSQLGDPLLVRDKLVYQLAQQKIFALEREETLSVSQDNVARLAKQQQDQRTNMRKRTAPMEPWLKLFTDILRESDFKLRCLLLLTFQRHLEHLNAESFNNKNPSYTALKRKIDREPHEESKLQDLRTKEADKTLGIEHLWRELSAMYTFDPMHDAYAEFPQLAAIHLLDGFTMEFIDGESCQINIDWLEVVLKKTSTLITETLQKAPKVMCLSVIGQESSGKSTLLNTMFGCRLRTSLLRCTKGINIQFVRCKERAYDYVLLLDVEGVRSSKLNARNDKYLHDNRLCSMAMFLCDAVIVIMNGNQMEQMSNILSMVRNADQRTNISNQGTFWKHPFFAQRGLNNISGQELENHQNDLKQILFDRRVYQQTEAFKFLFFPLASNDVSAEKAAEYGFQVKAMRESMGESVPSTGIDFDAFVVRSKSVREKLLDIEKIFNHIGIKEQVEHNETEAAYQAWRSSVERIYRDAFSMLERRIVKIKEYLKKGLEDVTKVDTMLNRLSIVDDGENEQKRAIRETVSKLSSTTGVTDTLLLSTYMAQLTKEKLDQEKKHFINLEIIQRSPRRENYLENVDDELLRLSQSCSQYVQQMVAAKLEMNNQLDQAIKTMIASAKQMYADGVAGRDTTIWNSWFTKIFQQQISSLSSVCRQRDIKKTIENIFLEKGITIPRQATQQYEATSPQQGIIDEFLYDINRFLAKVYTKLNGYALYQREIELSDLRKRCVHCIPPLDTASAMMFSIDSTEKFFSEVNGVIKMFNSTTRRHLQQSEYDFIMVEVMNAVTIYQTHCHQLWEELNHPVKLLQKRRAELYEICMKIFTGQNCVAIALYQSEILINGNLAGALHNWMVNKAFADIICRDITENIYLNSTIFQAYSDLDLLFQSPAEVIASLASPPKHYERCLDKCLENSLSKHSVPDIRAKIIAALTTAADALKTYVIESRVKLLEAKSQDVPTSFTHGCSSLFFKRLNTELDKNGILGFSFNAGEMTSLGGDALDSVNIAVELEDIHLVQIVTKIIKQNRINSAPAPDMTFCVGALKKKLINDVLSTQFRLRCPECCPMCGVQCDHSGGRGHPGEHKSYHQPQCLKGQIYISTNEMVFESCITCAAKDNRIIFQDTQTTIPYRQFHSAFSTWADLEWENEARCSPLKVREHLCFLHSDEIIKYHKLKSMVANPRLATSGYDLHKRQELQEELQAIVARNKA